MLKLSYYGRLWHESQPSKTHRFKLAPVLVFLVYHIRHRRIDPNLGVIALGYKVAGFCRTFEP
jgi:hypothetical protein